MNEEKDFSVAVLEVIADEIQFHRYFPAAGPWTDTPNNRGFFQTTIHLPGDGVFEFRDAARQVWDSASKEDGFAALSFPAAAVGHGSMLDPYKMMSVRVVGLRIGKLDENDERPVMFVVSTPMPNDALYVQWPPGQQDPAGPQGPISPVGNL